MSHKKILIVEDNFETGSYIEELLNEAGYYTIVCRSGQEAVLRVENHSVDVVLLDIIMPDVDGYTVASRIKELVGNREFLPVIMVTALDDPADKVTGLSYADDYITKPFSSDELLARIKTMLRIRALHQELSFSEKNYRYLYQNFPHFLVTLNPQFQIIKCNQLFCNCIGLSYESLCGRPFQSLLSEKDKIPFDQYLKKIHNTGVSSESQAFEILTSCGHTFFAEIKAACFDTHEPEAMVVMCLEDVTNKIRMEADRKLARKNLYRSAKLAAIGNLASGVAHEVNNPLTAILGFSDSLLERLRINQTIDKEEFRQYLEIINNETLRCRDIVENLSRFARISESVLTEVSLLQCIDSSLNLIRHRAFRAGISFINNVKVDILLNTDFDKIVQVLLSVFSNCVDFCNRNTNVAIEVSSSQNDSRMVRLDIVDEGPGIDPEIISKIFDPFFTTKQGYGTGMGLAICHRMMEECGGKIDVFGVLEGTRVVLEIPMAT